MSFIKHSQLILLTIFSRDALTEVWDLEAEIYKNTLGHTVENGDYVYGVALYVVHYDFCDSF